MIDRSRARLSHRSLPALIGCTIFAIVWLFTARHARRQTERAILGSRQ